MIKFRIAAFRAEPLVIEATDDDADRFAMSAVCRESSSVAPPIRLRSQKLAIRGHNCHSTTQAERSDR
jgi:hypothetical protein